jgi:carboxylesterase
MPSPVLPGAEPYSAAGGAHGVLVLHGLSGTPQSLRTLAEAFAAAGLTVELPLLPGHGTSPEDMAETTWTGWLDAAGSALRDLQGRCAKVVVAGLSMGGALALQLATVAPDLAGLILVNPGVGHVPAEQLARLTAALDAGVAFVPGLGGDIAEPGTTELAYDRLSIAAALSLAEPVERLRASLGEVRAPVLLFTSAVDHVVPAEAGDAVATGVSGPVERIVLARSFHVATLDHDRGEIEERSVAFARRVLGATEVAAG